MVVTEYASLGSLEDYFKKRGAWKLSLLRNRFSDGNKLACITQLMLGTNYLHQNNIIHGNLKPSNILIFEQVPNVYQFKICDFVASKTLKNIKKEILLDNISAWYAAPEQLNKKLKAQSPFLRDSWALGIIFYQLITGKEHPYKPDGEVKEFIP